MKGICLLVPFLLVGCHLQRTKEIISVETFHPSHPIVIIPGILGTRLKNSENDQVVWGRAFDLKARGFHHSPLSMFKAKPEDDGLELPIVHSDLKDNTDLLVPDGIMDRYTIIPDLVHVSVYQDLLDSFRACGYRPGQLENCQKGENVFVFYYDWRRDIVENVHLLSERIADIRRVNEDPALKVDLVAHSMGCLLSKYFLLYGSRDVLGDVPTPSPGEGQNEVRKVVFIAPPFEGSAAAWKYLHAGYRVGLQKISPEALFTMPSIMELLPQKLPLYDQEGKELPQSLDLYNPETWENLGLSIFSKKNWQPFEEECRQLYPDTWKSKTREAHDQIVRYLKQVLDRARAFHQAIDKPLNETPSLLIASETTPTLSGLTWNASNNRHPISFNKMSAGDGTVTFRSSTHQLPKNGTLKIIPGKHHKLPGQENVISAMVSFLSL